MKTFKQFQEETQQLDELAPLALIPAALKLGGAALDVFDVDDAAGIAENTYIIIDEESIYVDKKTDNQLFVKRGQDGTSPTEHVGGAAVNLITATTNDLIEVGDDFGFDGSLI